MHRPFPALALAAALVVASPAARALSAAEVFAKGSQSVYLIIVTSDEPGVVDVVAQGSAVLIAPGRFVTDCHVLERGQQFTVSRREDKIQERVTRVNVEKGKILCELDLVESKPGFNRPVDFVPPDSLQVGQPVFAISSPRGMELTVSNGIISGVRESNGGIKLLQTTAPFSPGSSGGGVFDEQGRLVGITTMISTNAVATNAVSTNAAAKNAQKSNFAVAAESIPSAGISAAELAKQRGVVSADAGAAPEVAPERVRRQEQDPVAVPARKKPLAEPAAPGQNKPATPGPVAAAGPVVARKPLAARLAPYQSMSDSTLPAKIYEQMARKGQLAGLEDDAAIGKVYETLIHQRVAEQLRWNEGGSYVCEFQIQLRRSGEVMFVIPGKPSGLERFDREAQRAIGAASPLPVPQDNDGFARVSEITLVVQAGPDRKVQMPVPSVAAPPNPVPSAPKKKKAK